VGESAVGVGSAGRIDECRRPESLAETFQFGRRGRALRNVDEAD
jgi:hypothetical protein